MVLREVTVSQFNSGLEQAYALLNLPLEAPLDAVESAYFKLRAEKIQHSQRDDIPVLKEAYQNLKQFLEQQILEQQSIEQQRPEPQGHGQPLGLHHTDAGDKSTPVSMLEQFLIARGVRNPSVQWRPSQFK